MQSARRAGDDHRRDQRRGGDAGVAAVDYFDSVDRAGLDLLARLRHAVAVADDAVARAGSILGGLGFDARDQAKATKEFSGGWRMRISLAQALFMKPDLLLLDEPTNHLDVHALTWLEEFLQRWEKTVVIVSHDRGFLNDTTTATMFLHNKRLRYYGGNYDTFVKVRSEHRANEAAVASNQNQRESHLKNFIQKFGQGHKKMVKQAQCRMKMLSKLQEERVDMDFDDPYLRLNFPSASPLPRPSRPHAGPWGASRCWAPLALGPRGCSPGFEAG